MSMRSETETGGQVGRGAASEAGTNSAPALALPPPATRPGSSEEPERSFIEQARRAQIIAAAVEVIADVGYGKASLAAIAARAGISKGVISYHFAGKNELIERVVIDIFTTGAEYMIERILAAPTPREMLRAYLVSNIEFIDRSRREMVALGEILVSHRKPDGTLFWGVAEEQPAIDSLTELFEWGQREGAFRDFDKRVMAVAIRRAIDGFPPQMLANPDLDASAFAEELVTLFDRATRKGDEDS